MARIWDVDSSDFDRARQRLPDVFNWLRQRLLVVLAIILVAGVVLTCSFTVSPEEVGVILRFGKYSRTVEPGLRFKAPLGIEQVIKLPVERQLKEEFGFRTMRPDVRTQYAGEDYPDESLMLTGDLSLADVEWIVQYRISDPQKFLFRVRYVQKTFRDMAEASMRQIVGDHTVDEVITLGRKDIELKVADLLQEMCVQYETGIKVEQVVLQNVTPPDPVKPSFNAVNEAEQQKEQLTNKAKAEYNKVVPRAKGEAEKVIEEAQGYALERVNMAQGEAARFDALFAEYAKAPEVTRRRIYLETLAKVLPMTGDKIIVDEKATGVIPLLQMQMNKSRKER
jgi:membrane protease subunit HflK